MPSRSDSTPPWKRKNPKTKKKTEGTRKKGGATNSKRLTASQLSEARARARKAGRKYPNLVDNMAVLRTRKKR